MTNNVPGWLLLAGRVRRIIDQQQKEVSAYNVYYCAVRSSINNYARSAGLSKYATCGPIPRLIADYVNYFVGRLCSHIYYLCLLIQ